MKTKRYEFDPCDGPGVSFTESGKFEEINSDDYPDLVCFERDVEKLESQLVRMAKATQYLRPVDHGPGEGMITKTFCGVCGASSYGPLDGRDHKDGCEAWEILEVTT
jgi:hypothetical protein